MSSDDYATHFRFIQCPLLTWSFIRMPQIWGGRRDNFEISKFSKDCMMSWRLLNDRRLCWYYFFFVCVCRKFSAKSNDFAVFHKKGVFSSHYFKSKEIKMPLTWSWRISMLLNIQKRITLPSDFDRNWPDSLIRMYAHVSARGIIILIISCNWMTSRN